jgi:hypothetical protein
VVLSDVSLKRRSLYFDIPSIVTVMHVCVAYFTALCGFFQGKHLTGPSISCGPLYWRCWLPICSVHHFRRRKTFVVLWTPSDIRLCISCMKFGPCIWQSGWHVLHVFVNSFCTNRIISSGLGHRSSLMLHTHSLSKCRACDCEMYILLISLILYNYYVSGRCHPVSNWNTQLLLLLRLEPTQLAPVSTANPYSRTMDSVQKQQLYYTITTHA